MMKTLDDDSRAHVRVTRKFVGLQVRGTRKSERADGKWQERKKGEGDAALIIVISPPLSGPRSPLPLPLPTVGVLDAFLEEAIHTSLKWKGTARSADNELMGRNEDLADRVKDEVHINQ